MHAVNNILDSVGHRGCALTQHKRTDLGIAICNLGLWQSRASSIVQYNSRKIRLRAKCPEKVILNESLQALVDHSYGIVFR